MYNQHFGLNSVPFKITPDPRLFYGGGQRGAILEALVYAVTSGEGIIKVVGEVGAGKTMLCRMLEVKLPSNVETVYLANPSLSPEDILQAIAIDITKAHAMTIEITNVMLCKCWLAFCIFIKTPNQSRVAIVPTILNVLKLTITINVMHEGHLILIGLGVD